MATPSRDKFLQRFDRETLPCEQCNSVESIQTDYAVHDVRQGGLGSREVSERLKKYGPNRLPTAGKRGPLMRFLMQINNVLIYVLLAAALGKVLLGEWLDASVILGVVIINALLGFVQEGKAEKALDSIRNMLSAEAMALREGKTRMIPAEELGPRRRGPAAIGRQGPRRHSSLRGQKPPR
jgi:magnesium-transporting ATPase (P-type)